MRRDRLPLPAVLAFAAILLLFCSPVDAQRRQPGAAGGGMDPSMRTFSLSGYVVEAGTFERIENVRVDLRSRTGPIVATVFTRSNGDFEFNNLRPGTYELVLTPIGYEPSTRIVNLDFGSIAGLDVELHRERSNSEQPPQGGNNTVSVREISVPKKAHDALTKGMALLYQKSDYSASLKQFQRAIETYPNYYEAYTQMGVAYAQSGDTAASEEALRKSIELSQEHYAAAFWVLAGILSDKKRFVDAEPLARKGADLDPTSWQANFELARALLGLNRTVEAERPAQAAVDAQPSNPTPYLALANVHNRLRKYNALLSDLNNYLRLAPNGKFALEVRTRRDEVVQILAKSELPQTLPTPPK